MIRTALSYHAPLATDLARHLRGQVLSAHPQAVNLLFEGRQVVALVTPEVGDGPGGVVVRGRIPWLEGDYVRAADRFIVGPGFSIYLGTGVQAWSPPPSPVPGAPAPGAAHAAVAPALQALAASGRHEGILPAALGALGQWVIRPEAPIARALFDLARQGIDLLAAGEMSAGARRLAGLGPGLTPSGDDFLCGYACLLHRAASPLARPLSEALLALPASASPTLSRHFLHWAAAGVAGVHHLAWADGLLTGAAPEGLLQPLLTHGATSGTDWAAGALTALFHNATHASKGE